MSILKLLRGLGETAETEASSETETVRQIVQKLDQLPPEQASYVAAFAYVLSRVAQADMDISDAETREMERIVVEHGGLPEQQAIIVVQMAKTRSRLFGGTEDFVVTREFANMATHEQKLALLDCLFAVGAADMSISTVEDAVARQVADQLNLEHRDFIAVRSRYRDRLSVLRDTKKD